MSANNNVERILPVISVTWDEDAQTVAVSFNNHQFKTWEFVQAILVMGQEQCKVKAAMIRAAQMQQAVMQQAQDQALKQKIMRG